MTIDKDPIEAVPAPCHLGSSEIECMYCPRTISRTTAHRTCFACTQNWVKEYGKKWYEQEWHTALVEEHENVFDRTRHAPTTSIEAHEIDFSPKDLAEPLPDGWLPEPDLREAFLAAKDTYLTAKAQGVRAGRVRIHKELVRMGIPCIPDIWTLQDWLDIIKCENGEDEVSTYRAMEADEALRKQAA